MPIPTNTRQAGYIDRDDEYCHSIRWSINSLFSHHLRNWPSGRFVSQHFTILSIDGNNILTWYLALVKSADSDDYFHLFPCFPPENDCKEVSVKIELSVMDETRINKQWSFSIGDVFTFDARDESSPIHVPFNARKHVYRSNTTVEDTLVVVCDIIQSDLPKSLSRFLEDAFISQDLTDIALLSKDGKVYKAHKVMLAARSSVFAAMFKHDEMKESKHREVKIDDINGDVIEEMLRFVYTEKSENLKIMAKDLLIAAEKYDLKKLKIVCEDAFIADLSVANAVEMLQFSDLHNAYRLQSAAFEFVIGNYGEVKNTEAWKSLDQSSLHLVKAICDDIMSRHKSSE